MNSHLNKIIRYLSNLSEHTVVSLFIGSRSFACMKQFSDDFLKLNNIVDVKLNYETFSNQGNEITEFEKDFAVKVLSKPSLKEINLMSFINEKNLTMERKELLKEIVMNSNNWNWASFTNNEFTNYIITEG